MLWDAVYPDRAPDAGLADGEVVRVGGRELRVLHTPGHSPGGCCLLGADGGGAVFAATRCSTAGPAPPAGRSPTSAPSSRASATRLLPLPADTVVHTGHGDDTTIGDEAPHLDEWIARGH